MAKQQKYDVEYKIQAIKLAKEVGSVKATAELGIPVNTLYGWQRAVREGRLDIGQGAHTPQTALSLAEELTNLRNQVKEQDKEIRRLKEENEFLEEASAFFAASRRKSARTRE
ncbi:transposase [Megasphaera paucivorans]|uniref:Transposase n=1 Tax=Megasphaera paucivorans TaxID=349095 RepID=A0A1G9TU03_9FIRM|nr:transposase [Megasphaera paucivorans]SDM51270.1 transposase [Megasphaera paucivorans]